MTALTVGLAGTSFEHWAMYLSISRGMRDSVSASELECPGRYLIVKLKSASSTTQRWAVACNFAEDII